MSTAAAGGGYTCCPGRSLDPLVDIGLTAAGEILARNDPEARDTVGYIRRIIVAPAPPWSGWFGITERQKLTKVSDLNGTLSAVAWVRENPWSLPLAVVSVLAATFLLGRATARPAGAAA